MKKTKPNRNYKPKTEKQHLKTFMQIELISVLIYVAVFIISTAIALSSDLSSRYDYIFSMITFAISSIITGFIAGIKLRQNGLLVGITYSLPMNIIVMLISLILNKFTININIAITAIILILAAGIGGIIAVNKRLKR